MIFSCTTHLHRIVHCHIAPFLIQNLNPFDFVFLYRCQTNCQRCRIREYSRTSVYMQQFCQRTLPWYRRDFCNHQSSQRIMQHGIIRLSKQLFRLNIHPSPFFSLRILFCLAIPYRLFYNGIILYHAAMFSHFRFKLYQISPKVQGQLLYFCTFRLLQSSVFRYTLIILHKRFLALDVFRNFLYAKPFLNRVFLFLFCALFQRLFLYYPQFLN